MEFHLKSDSYFNKIDFNDLFETAKDFQTPIDYIEEEQQTLKICPEETLDIFAKNKPMEEEEEQEEESPVLGSTDDSDSPAEDIRDEVFTPESKIVNKKISKAEKPKKAAKTPEGKRAQNPLKNAAGTLTAKLKKCTEEEAALYKHVCDHLRLTEETKEEFKAYFRSYNKNDKTWSKIDALVGEKTGFGVFLAEMGIAFLSEIFEKDYTEFINNGQLSETNKALYLDQENKDLWTSKFMAMRNKYNGDASDYKAKIRGTKKNMKLNKASKTNECDSCDSYFSDFSMITENNYFENDDLNLNFSYVASMK